MTTIISKRDGEWLLDAAAGAGESAPFAARHGRMMHWWGKLGFLDQNDLKQMLAFCPKGYEWMSSIPDSVAVAIYKVYPHVFDDTTGKSLEKFLASDAGRRYRVPGNKVIKL